MDLSIILSARMPDKHNTGVPSLRRLISQGKALDIRHHNPFEFLLDQFDYNDSVNQGVSIAFATASVDLEQVENRYWMRADPVFLQTDLTSLVLFDSRNFALSETEVQDYFSIINPVIEDDGLKLISGSEPSRWYVTPEKDPLLKTAPPGDVNGKEIREFLPKGVDRNTWIRLTNEIQMLLHDCSINLKRQHKGLLPVNSVWFWGADKLPVPISCNVDKIISDDVNAQGLATMANLPHESIPENFSDWLASQPEQQRVLMVLARGDLALSAYNHHDKWLNNLDKQVFTPLISALKKGTLKTLEVFTQEHHSLVRKHHLYQFWRRS